MKDKFCYEGATDERRPMRCTIPIGGLVFMYRPAFDRGIAVTRLVARYFVHVLNDKIRQAR
jgi:hypothetical protein